ncbi:MULTISPECIES: acyltransferase [unclassified Vibrio]|uniref:Acyltransferase n=2 Tax=Vibrio anguillarum TaxID=55601 RepID=A0AAW4BGM4_VIBAN|nr:MULTISPECIES: acyltransferase [unclassified Vibrio]MBF4434718.1 acyltransferase [Vibrio anguillarum]NAW89938.1 acyltransferase [Vibrio sp. V24_P1S3T111]OXX20867.1 hexapeptide transferase [Vibrio sp. V06_P1A73T115]OXX26172.1 hexapeptide transferase [Vibrio sp. V05_P4A8T149]OXX30771.1 hexapeptide transferase [Vibrio sp. V04_P4A5T148]
MSGFSFIEKLRNKIRIKPNNHIQVGQNTRIRYCDIHVNGKNNHLIIHDDANLKGVSIELNGENCTLEIGANCVIGENCFFSCRERNTQLVIGDNCMFSRNVKIMTSDGHNILQNGKRINLAKSIYIGSHVWLADNVTVLKGVNIGNNSVVGINSTITNSVSANVIAVGNPAEVIKDNTSWEDKLSY